MKNKTNYRTNKTKNQIREGFIKLLEEKSFEKISIIDIANASSINRVTFYTHYKDKIDLVNDIIDEVFSHIRDEAKNYSMQCKDSDMLVNYIKGLSYSFFELCKNHQILFQNLNEHQNAFILDLIKTKAYEYTKDTIDLLGKYKILKYTPEGIAHFLVGGFSEVIFYWIYNNKGIEEETFIAQLNKFSDQILKSNILFDD